MRLAVSVLFSEERAGFLLCLMERGVLMHPAGKGLVALILYRQNNYPNFSFTYFVLDIRPEPVFQAGITKLETEFGKNKKYSKNRSFYSKLKSAFFFPVNDTILILKQLVKLTPCQCKLDGGYFQDTLNQKQVEMEIIRLVCAAY